MSTPTTPAGRALLALLQVDDRMEPALAASEFVERDDTLTVLVDTHEAWATWLVELNCTADVPLMAHVEVNLSTAQTTVHGYPVMVVRAECPPRMPAMAASLKAVA